jgi:hypothetical protein
MGTFIVDDIISENGFTATTSNVTTIISNSISATTFYGNGSNLTNLTGTPLLSGPNNSIQYNENNTLSGSSKFIYSGDSLSFTGTSIFNGLFYTLGSLSAKIKYQWFGTYGIGGTGIVWTNMPAATSTWLGTTLTGDATYISDLTEYTECRLFTSVQVAGNVGSALTVQYSTDNTVWSTLVNRAIGTGTGVRDSGWVSIPGGARTFVYIRLVGSGGNGVIDPRFSPPILLIR